MKKYIIYSLNVIYILLITLLATNKAQCQQQDHIFTCDVRCGYPNTYCLDHYDGSGFYTDVKILVNHPVGHDRQSITTDFGNDAQVTEIDHSTYDADPFFDRVSIYTVRYTTAGYKIQVGNGSDNITMALGGNTTNTSTIQGYANMWQSINVRSGSKLYIGSNGSVTAGNLSLGNITIRDAFRAVNADYNTSIDIRSGARITFTDNYTGVYLQPKPTNAPTSTALVNIGGIDFQGVASLKSPRAGQGSESGIEAFDATIRLGLPTGSGSPFCNFNTLEYGIKSTNTAIKHYTNINFRNLRKLGNYNFTKDRVGTAIYMKNNSSFSFYSGGIDVRDCNQAVYANNSIFNANGGFIGTGATTTSTTSKGIEIVNNQSQNASIGGVTINVDETAIALNNCNGGFLSYCWQPNQGGFKTAYK